MLLSFTAASKCGQQPTIDIMSHFTLLVCTKRAETTFVSTERLFSELESKLQCYFVILLNNKSVSPQESTFQGLLFQWLHCKDFKKLDSKSWNTLCGTPCSMIFI